MKAETPGPLSPERLDALGSQPTVSVVLAVRNEAAHLATTLESLWSQGYADVTDIVIAVAPSSDGTAELAGRLTVDDERVVVIDNPEGHVSFGLNRAIERSAGEVVVRVDGHCILPPDYIERAVATMRRTGAAVVGGVQRAVGDDGFPAAVAVAMSSPLGVGNATFHMGGSGGPTDTVFLGVFRSVALRAVDGYNTRLVRNQDYELNWRIRQQGGVVWLDPDIEVVYRPRSTPKALWRQYFEYGWWKRVMLSEHPESLRVRQAAPPVLVLGLTASIAGAIASGRAKWLTPAVGYTLAVVFGGLKVSRGHEFRTRAQVPVALVTMHVGWGSGFLASAASALGGRIWPVSRCRRNPSKGSPR